MDQLGGFYRIWSFGRGTSLQRNVYCYGPKYILIYLTGIISTHFVHNSGLDEYDYNDGTQILNIIDACFSKSDTIETDY